MSTRALVLIAVLLAATNALALTNDFYTVTLVNGYNAVANQLNKGTNPITTVLASVTNLPDGSYLVKYSLPNAPAAGFGNPDYYIGGHWRQADSTTAPLSTTTLNPGEGAILFNNGGSNSSITFSGQDNGPVLPIRVACGEYYFLSRETNGIGIYENITGISPEDGDQILVYDTAIQGNISDMLNSYDTHTFCGGGWVPNLPYVSIGQSVFVRQACLNNGCLTVQASNIVVTSATPIAVNFQPIVVESCPGIDEIFSYCRPPSGSVFFPGTTPVHCVGIDINGSAASADFTVTVAPAAFQPPTESYKIKINAVSNLIAYQFTNGGNTLREIMTNVPDGTVVSKWDNTLSTWFQSTYSASVNGWVPPNIVLRPGEGAFLVNPTNTEGQGTNFTLTLAGQPSTPVLPISLSNSIVLVSRQTNAVGDYRTITGIPPQEGSTVYQWNGTGYDIFQFDGTSWSPSVPSIAVGESCWISPNGSASPPGIPSPPAINHSPQSLNVALGSRFTLVENIAGTGPFLIQWRLNGNAIPGATSATYIIKSFQAANGGSYDVLVQNSLGTVQDTIGNVTVANATVLPFSDSSANAGSLQAPSGFGVGSNVGATTQSDENGPGFIPGGASVWIRWTAPGNGVATFTTAGSSFDTTMAIYTGSGVGNLSPITFDDDAAGFLCSSVKFSAIGGTTYLIQIDGFYGAMGNIALSWNLQSISASLPVIVTQPQHQTVGIGGKATFALGFQPGAGPPPVAYQWFQNGVAISGANSSSLTITKVTPANVGVYQVSLSNPANGVSEVSFPTDLQINIPDAGQQVNPSARAETKFQATFDSTESTNDPYDPTIVAGYTGQQICSAYGAMSEPAEPIHCGVITVATLWHGVAAPGTGLLSVANTGTAFKGVLAVYASANLGLTPLACSAGHAAGQEICTFEATNGVTYEVAMSVTNLADINGPVFLKSTLLSPPTFTSLPSAIGTASNVPVSFGCATAGSATIGYQWLLNGTNIPGATGSSLSFASFKLTNSGNYSVLATNSAGSNLYSFAPIYVDIPLEFVNTMSLGANFFTQLIGMPNSNYIFQTSTDLENWTSNSAGSSATGVITFMDTINTNNTGYFYRAYLPIIK